MTFKDFIEKEKKEEYFQKLEDFIQLEYQTYRCHPEINQIYRAFELCDFEQTKVVILGQDPYHNDLQAHGLAFSVLTKKLPPSLKNIYKEMATDLNIEVSQDGNLEYLAKQGVLLLNTILTVRHNEPLSHKNRGWEIFTNKIIQLLNDMKSPICFILWGANALSKRVLITNPNHLVLGSAHPSPLSAFHGFFGSKPFSKCNAFLEKNNLVPIKWAK